MIDWEKVVLAVIPEQRKEILEYLDEHEQASPVGYSRANNVRLGNVSYDFRVLKQQGWIEVTRKEQRRGATEHFYSLTEAVKLSAV